MITQISEKVVQLIKDRMEARNGFGYEKYGETLDDVPFENYNWTQMMNEELLDGLQYAVKEIERLNMELNVVQELLEEKTALVDTKVFENDVDRTFRKLSVIEGIMNCALGIVGEGGEVADIIKKVVYQGHDLNHVDVIDELGDVLYYVTKMAKLMDSSLDEVMTMNMMKRMKRYPNGFNKNRSVNRDE
jgi:NTP pyrophosphatase (non-canonical NTP hydrolase)